MVLLRPLSAVWYMGPGRAWLCRDVSHVLKDVIDEDRRWPGTYFGLEPRSAHPSCMYLFHIILPSHRYARYCSYIKAYLPITLVPTIFILVLIAENTLLTIQGRDLTAFDPWSVKWSSNWAPSSKPRRSRTALFLSISYPQWTERPTSVMTRKTTQWDAHLRSWPKLQKTSIFPLRMIRKLFCDTTLHLRGPERCTSAMPKKKNSR